MNESELFYKLDAEVQDRMSISPAISLLVRRIKAGR